MISGDFLYYGMNALIGIVALLSLFAIPKLIPDAQSSKRLRVALLLLILSDIVFSIALRIFRMAPAIYAGGLIGKVPKWAYPVVDGFKNLALAGNILELAALIVLISVTKVLVGKVSSISGKESA
jgi:hypothetical protein